MARSGRATPSANRLLLGTADSRDQSLHLLLGHTTAGVLIKDRDEGPIAKFKPSKERGANLGGTGGKRADNGRAERIFARGGMAMAQSGAPKGWALQGSKPDAYVVQLDSAQKGPYGNSVLLHSKADSDGSATLMQAIKADDYRGKRVRFAGYIKGQGVKSWAGLWMRINNNENKVTAFDNMEKRAFRGDGDWKKFEVVLDIPRDSGTISFGALLSGTGRIWVSGLEFQVVDETVPVTAKSYAPELNRKPENLELN